MTPHVRSIVAALAGAAVLGTASLGCQSRSDTAQTARPTPRATENLPSLARRASPEARPAERGDAPPPPFEAPQNAGAGFSKREARRLAEQIAKDRLGRDLSAADADRAADAIIALRTAARALRTTEDGSPEQARQRQVLQSALTELATTTGVALSELPPAITNDRGR